MTGISTSNKVNRIRDRSPLSRAILYFVAALVAFITIYPMYYVLVLSLSAPREALTMRVYWWPKGFFVDSYTRILSDNQLWTSYRNTIIYCSSRAVLTLLTSVMAAYPLTVPHLFGRKFVTMFLLIPMYVTGGIIPEFILMTKLGLYNTPWSLILPGSYSIWYIILVRSYFRTVPEALRESAKIDGANSYQILKDVFLPTSKPILAVVALYTIIGVWNSWYHASVYITDREWQPLQLFLRRVLVEQTEQLSNLAFADAEAVERAQEQQISNNQLKYTIIIISSLPMLVAYPFFQKYFVQGVMLGSLKE
ncbi:MAG TPA: carbohydrate ABC transporter permease [Candidatus Ornithocaccomicrobium faecavium]|uniref:Carbohydrate ABC transporter permease n=1 Tax=Candidatus Ornithocaccomicrobium faecavium TaxID=2840890 RepID=A0A9D1P6F8_9FIRM|nr:carbohydrate ABC transporter permease [Clostridiales bacterium]HIV27142.1 carbohydrate ABC transporter permease [Candidatus Ornithocaccomicrobium faecavium]